MSSTEEIEAIKKVKAQLAAIPLVEVACVGVGGTEEAPMLYVYLKTRAPRCAKLTKSMGRYRVEYINGAPRPAASAVEPPKAEPPKASPSSRVGSVK